MASSSFFSCKGCGKSFTSKNQLFRHLNQNAKTCLTPEEYQEFSKHVLAVSREKIGVLYGYLPGTDYRISRSRHDDDSTMMSCDDNNSQSQCGIEGGQHAAWLVAQVIDKVSRGVNGNDDSAFEKTISWHADAAADSKINRSYGSTARGTDAVSQDPHTGAITEVLCTTALPLFIEGGSNDDEEKETEEVTKAKETELKKKTNAWVDIVNKELDQVLTEMRSTRSTSSSQSNENDIPEWSPGRMRVFGRVQIPKKFNAESDVTHRRVDYCFPVDLIYASDKENMSKTAVQPDVSSLQEYCHALPSFPPGKVVPHRESDTSFPPTLVQTIIRPSDNTLVCLREMKRVMKRISTQVEELDEKEASEWLEKQHHEARRNKKKQTGNSKTTEPKSKKSKNSTSDGVPKRLLKRKRFHNFCPNILAHDFLAFRRLDRVFHRHTVRLEDFASSNGTSVAPVVSSAMIKSRPFLIFSLSGDLFLQEQAIRIIGLIFAIFRGVIDDDIIDCIFDEEYTNLVTAPPAPRIGLIAGEATYMTWEGRLKSVLSARLIDRYSKGWNDEVVIGAVEEWEKTLLNDVAQSWYCDGVAEDGRLNAEKEWHENVLHPWAEKTQVLLEDYRRWKASRDTKSSLGSSFLPSLKSIDSTVPSVFEKVLYHLRQADKSGLWPTTTPNRQLVMLTTSNEGSQVQSLASAHMAAKKDSLGKETGVRSSPYSFKEGEGGASGSFSVGAMPGDQCSQPKGNVLFPELVKAAFELEIALYPDREPSSTIAINRNAQFRPHTDNGAGFGQSKSLIVGLGTYVGGELMVEGAQKDIRYKAIEFDGWKERHWTLPFQGERYSLVWFTPKGCGGVRGIDLNLASP